MRIASRTVTIQRPLDVVARQFADVAHHEATGVHPDVRFTVVDESTTHCDYDQVTRQGPVRMWQRLRLDRSDPMHQVHTVTDGRFAGGTLAFDLAEPAAGTTTVTATLSSPRRALRLLGPLLGRELGKALEEDRADLESGTYERHASTPGG